MYSQADNLCLGTSADTRSKMRVIRTDPPLFPTWEWHGSAVQEQPTFWKTLQDSCVNLHFLTGSQESLHAVPFLARVLSPVQCLPVFSVTDNLEMTEHLQQLGKGYTNTVTFYTRLEHSQT